MAQRHFPDPFDLGTVVFRRSQEPGIIEPLGVEARFVAPLLSTPFQVDPVWGWAGAYTEEDDLEDFQRLVSTDRVHNGDRFYQVFPHLFWEDTADTRHERLWCSYIAIGPMLAVGDTSAEDDSVQEEFENRFRKVIDHVRRESTIDWLGMYLYHPDQSKSEVKETRHLYSKLSKVFWVEKQEDQAPTNRLTKLLPRFLR